MATIEWIQALLGSQFQPLFMAITNLGSRYAYIVILTLYYWLIDPVAGRQLGILTSLSYTVNICLKDVFAVPRPFVLKPEIASEAAKVTSGARRKRDKVIDQCVSHAAKGQPDQRGRVLGSVISINRIDVCQDTERNNVKCRRQNLCLY